MPRTFDRRVEAVADKDPTRFGIDYQDPMGAIGESGQRAGAQIRDNLVASIREITGIDLTGVAAFLAWLGQALGVDNLIEWVHNVGAFTRDVISQIVEALRGLPGTLEDLAEWSQNAIHDLGGMISGVLGRTGAAASELVEWMLGLLGFGGIHAAGSLFGTGQLGNVNPELLINGSFDSNTSMPAAAGGWDWDDSVDHTGREGSGSAKVIANGTLRSMLSNAIDVIDSNQIDASVWVKWTGRTGTGPVSLVLNVYDATDTVIDTAVFKSATTGSTSDWQKLSGSYRVPAKVGNKIPTHVCAAFVIDPAVTAGTFWWDDASLKKINPISHKLVDGFQDTIENVTGKAGAGLTDFVDALQSFDRIKTGTVIDDFVPAVGRLLENGIRGLLGLPPETGAVYSHEDFLAAAVAANDSIRGSGNSIATIWQYLNAGVYDEFERSGPNLGANWSVWGFGNGNLITEGHNAALPFVWPGGIAEKYARWAGTNASSVSDYQQVSIVLGSAAGAAILGYQGHNDVLARVGGSTHYLRFRVGGDGSWSMSKIVNGTAYPLYDTDGVVQSGAAGSVKRPGPGSTITLYAGEKSSSTARRFKAVINGTIICDFEEKTSVAGVPDSVYGSSYRGRGFGMRAEGLLFLAGRVAPGMVNYWSGSDQP